MPIREREKVVISVSEKIVTEKELTHLQNSANFQRNFSWVTFFVRNQRIRASKKVIQKKNTAVESLCINRGLRTDHKRVNKIET